jgi:signal transduction histidine kinase
MKWSSVLLVLMLFFGCTDRNKENTNHDKISELLVKATDRNLNYNERRNISLQTLKILSTQKNDSVNRLQLNKLSYNFIVINDWNNFLITNKIAFERAFNSNDLMQIGLCKNYKGIYFENISNNDSAYYYYLKSEKIFKKINALRELCSVYRDKAQVQFYINDYLGSEGSLVDALKIANTNNFVTDQYLIYTFLGINSNELGDYSMSFNYHFKAIKLIENNAELFDNTDLATCYNNIGYNYLSIGNYRNAINFFDKGLRLDNIKVTFPYLYCKLIENKVYSKLNLNDYENIDSDLKITLKIREKYNVLNGKNFNRLYLSYYYADMHDLPKANQYAQEALAISKSFKAPKDQLLCLKQLIKINPEKALAYSSQYISLTDSMQKMERQTRNKFAKIAFETDEITKEKAAVEEQYTRIVWVCLIISVILILLFVIGKQLLKQKEFRLQQVQQQTNVEIYNLLLAQQNKIDNARNSEKERISKDLHDGVLNRLASTRMNLTSLISVPTTDNINKSKGLIEGIQEVEKEIRNISHDLNKDILMKSVSFVNVITTYMEEQYEATQIKNFLEFDSKINWDLIPGMVKIHLYRIVQESMQNIAKHAHASSIILSFQSVEGGLRLEIFDDGVGFLLNKKKKGIGLQNIYSRTASCNGTVIIESKKGIGTTIKVVVPYQD